MAAAELCLIRKLGYGEIIRKIGFQAFNCAADARQHQGTPAASRSPWTVHPSSNGRLS
jgi:hypothetical protein